MGATAHLALFNRTAAAFDALSEEDADDVPDGWTTSRRATATTTEPATATLAGRRVQASGNELDDEFESLLETEDILALNAAWLRSQEGLLVLADEQLELHIAERVAQIPNLAERQAEAAEEALENAPEFELIIRELCDVAGHELQKITMGDPNYEHNGETVLAWHFTTDHGDFIMVEEDDEAYMISPSTKEIVAAVEFEEADEVTGGRAAPLGQMCPFVSRRWADPGPCASSAPGSSSCSSRAVPWWADSSRKKLCRSSTCPTVSPLNRSCTLAPGGRWADWMLPAIFGRRS